MDDVEWPAAASSHRRYDQTAKVSIVLPTFNGVRYLRESIARLSPDESPRGMAAMDLGYTLGLDWAADPSDDRWRAARAELDALVPELIELILVVIHAGLTPASAVLRLGTAAPEPLVPALRSVEERARSGDRRSERAR